MVANINDQLLQGWNPCLSLNNPEEYTLFDEVCESYYRYLYKLAESGIMRVKTYNGYTSFLNVFREWNRGLAKPVWRNRSAASTSLRPPLSLSLTAC